MAKTRTAKRRLAVHSGGSAGARQSDRRHAAHHSATGDHPAGVFTGGHAGCTAAEQIQVNWELYIANDSYT